MGQWIDVGAADSVTESNPLTTEVDGYPIVIVPCGKDFFAVEDRCSHDGESLAGAEVEACEIICPRHGARFDLRTGDARSRFVWRMDASWWSSPECCG
jgi:3-phenylpropionate/trans-cinnamate dioxygenase ferredoxin subunit